MNQRLIKCMIASLTFITISVGATVRTTSGIDEDPSTGTATAQTPSVELTWPNGDLLQGRLLSINSQSVLIQSPLFREPVDIRRQNLKNIRFAIKQPAKPQVVATYTLVIVDGSQFSGAIVSTTDETILFRDLRFGELSIARSQVARIEQANQLLYVWSGNLSDWQSTSLGLPGKWSLENGTNLTTSDSDARLWLPVGLPDSFAIDFTIQSQDVLDFFLATALEPEKALRFAKIGESWILGTANDFEIVESLPSDAKQVRLRITWNATTRKFSLFENGKLLIAIDDPESTSLRSGILLGNQGKSLSLTALKIGTLASTQLESTLDIDRPAVAPDPAQFDWIQLSDGSFAWGTLQEIKDGIVSFVVDAMALTVKCEVDLMRQFRPKSANQPQQSNSPHVVQYGENHLLGSFVLNSEKREVLWRSANLITEAIIDHRLQVNFQVLARNSVSPVQTSGFSNVLYLENGDMLPCKLQRATAANAWLQTPFATEIAQVENRYLRAVELENRAKDKPSFTNESREILLSIPRSLESDTYTHALIGKNGDLLRGNVVSISDESIEIDSKFEPIVLDREPVAGVVFLRPHVNASEKQDSQVDTKQNDPRQNPEQNPEQSPEQKPEQLLRIEMLGGYSLSGRWVGGTPETIRLQSTALGPCQIQLTQVIGIEFNQRSVTTLEGYFAWNTKSSMAPRWKAATESAGKAASELAGSQAPDFALSDIQGGTFRLSQQAGKIVVLDFWATWCAPCVASLPKYIDLFAEFPDTEVVFYGVNSTETPEVVREFVSKKNWTKFKTLFDYDRSTAQLLRVQGIPHTVVIGSDGKIKHVQVGFAPGAAEELRQVIQGLLK